MNTLLFSALALCLVHSFSIDTPDKDNVKRDHPTKLAKYQVGTFVTADQKKLRVNIDKELGGDIYVQLFDTNGNQYLNQKISAAENTARLSLDITDLAEGTYTLKITNGLEVEIRTVKISATSYVPAKRMLNALP